MKIGHFKATPIAYAPEAISCVINKYTDHQAYVFGYSYNMNIENGTNIVHQHNKNTVIFPKKIIQYHSEPFRVDLNVNIPRLVIAQYHAFLPEYKGAIIVRNPIDFFDDLYAPKYVSNKIRIGYSPSAITPLSSWHDKGYAETVPILNKVQKKFRKNVEIDIITNVSLEECLIRKSKCNIFIDEVKTTSYHRSGLESLSMGILTICSLSAEIENLILEKSGASVSPFVNVYYPDLYKTLVFWIDNGIDNILQKGFESRQWMEQYWHPKTIAEEYINIYKNL